MKRYAGVGRAALADLHGLLGGRVLRTFRSVGRLELVSVPAGRTVGDVLETYRASALVEYAEPDFEVRAAADPNDPLYRRNYLWGLRNVGLAHGTPGADIDAAEGWEILSAAPNVIVAIIDSGLRYTHEDLAANVWTNPGEIPGNGVDDDLDGYVDDVHGINAITHGGDPKDESGHGTAVAGTLGAVGNNGKGVVGVAWRVQLLPCKFLAGRESSYVSQAIECIDFALAKGAHIINASWGGDSYSQALYDAIATTRAAGIPFVAAAGNNASNNDARPFYPASYDLDNIVSVAATTRTDELAPFSDYGATSVDIAAPGASIVSTFASSDSRYVVFRGTSMAAPYVAGALALLRARFPTNDHAALIQRVFAGVDQLPGLSGRCVTGGRLNLARALGTRLSMEDVAVPEGHSGTVDAVVTVSLGWPALDTVTVDWATADGTARNGEDYSGGSGTLSFPPGTTSGEIRVPVFGDSLFEAAETIVVRLSNQVGAALATPQARIRIQNDDPRPTFSFASSLGASTHEGAIVSLPVMLSAPAGAALAFGYWTCGGTATPYIDYEPAIPGTVVFPPGTTQAAIEVRIRADPLVEPAEFLFVDLLNGHSFSPRRVCRLQKRVDILDGP